MTNSLYDLLVWTLVLALGLHPGPRHHLHPRLHNLNRLCTLTPTKTLSEPVLPVHLTVAYDSPAQIAGISSSCQEASEILLASDLGCANLKDLQPILSSNLSSNVLPAFIAWIEEICPTSPCSDSVINTAVKILEKGCASELTIGTSALVVLSGVIENHLPLRRMVCEQYKSNGSYCVTSLLTNIGQNLTITTLKTILIDGFSSLVPLLTGVHKFAFCNDCGHVLYNDAVTLKSQKDSETIESSKDSEREKILTEICGSSFLDGKVPTTIQPAPITHHSTSSKVPAKSSTCQKVLIRSISYILISFIVTLHLSLVT